MLGFNIAQEDDPPGPDGISFVIQNAGPSPALTSGGNMGYSGIVDSVAVEFDCFENENRNDPEPDHVSVQTGGIGQPNSSTHGGQYELDKELLIGPLDSGTMKTARIIYDARARKLTVTLNGGTVLDLPNFRLLDHMALDEGRAYLGIVSSTGDPTNPTGPVSLMEWNAVFPQSCEEAVWVQPMNDAWNNSGYPGDTFDHIVTGDFLIEGDVVKEEILHVSDNMGMNSDEIDDLEERAAGEWRIGVRPGLSGLRRMKRLDTDADGRHFDHHSFTVSNVGSMQTHFESGANSGDVVLIQTMRHIGTLNSQGQLIAGSGTGAVVARHKIFYRFARIAPELTEQGPDGLPLCTYSDGLVAHVVVKKRYAFNDLVWPSVQADPPIMPCEPD